MTPTQTRIKVAELCGWKFDWTDAGCHITQPGEDSQWDALDGEPGDVERLLDMWCVPDYPRSFEAMHEAEKTIDNDDLRYLYVTHVSNLNNGGNGALRWWGRWANATATPAIKAEAFIMAHESYSHTFAVWKKSTSESQ